MFVYIKYFLRDEFILYRSFIPCGYIELYIPPPSITRGIPLESSEKSDITRYTVVNLSSSFVNCHSLSSAKRK